MELKNISGGKFSRLTKLGFLTMLFGLYMVLPFGHNGIMNLRDSIVGHTFRNPENYRNILVTLGCFIIGLGGIISSLQIKDKMIKISDKVLYTSAYLYLAVPIVVFFLGWLKLPFGIIFSAVLLYGIYWNIKENHSVKKSTDEDSFEISVKSLVFILSVVLVWVWIAGVGGGSYQHEDLHWRNAYFRDLIDYSWPVVYPETGNALVYYYIFNLVPALVGKIFGWAAANIALYFIASFGIFLAAIFLVKYLKVKSFYKAVATILVFMFWSGLCYWGVVALGLLNKGTWIIGGYNGWADADRFLGIQFPSNIAQIYWVFNQAIVPWVAVSVFLNEKKISSLALLGLCALPCAPFPFVGIFILFLAWGVAEILKNYKTSGYYRQVLSVSNICAFFSVFLVFLLFYKLNSSASGSAGYGGVCLYFSDIGPRFFAKYFFYMLIEFIFYSILIYKDNKKSILFYTIIVSLFLIPFIKVGTSRDFCMRASIPAMFMLMAFYLKSMFSEENSIARKNVLIITFIFASLNGIGTFFDPVFNMVQRRNTVILADDFHTFSDKYESGNFLVSEPYQKTFFKYLAKKKSDRAFRKDAVTHINFLAQRGLSIGEGEYFISPVLLENNYLSLTDNDKRVREGVGKEIWVSSEKIPLRVFVASPNWGDWVKETDCYRIKFPNYMNLDVPYGEMDADGSVWGHWENTSPAQKWHIQKAENGYRIINGSAALSYDADLELVYLSPVSDDAKQLWNFERKNPNSFYDRFVTVRESGLSLKDFEIRSQFTFDDYLRTLKKNSEKYSIFISVCEGAFESFTSESQRLINDLGLDVDFNQNGRKSYIAVLDKGNKILETVGGNDADMLRHFGVLDNGVSYNIESASQQAGNFCSIIVNGTQYARNGRGLNFVVYDNELKTVVDSVSFDTARPDMKCYRE